MSSVGDMIDRVVALGGQISFNLEGIMRVDEVFASDTWLDGTAQQLQHICGSPGARSATPFFTGQAPC